MIVNHENSFSAINDETRAVGDDREKASVYDVKVRFIALPASKALSRSWEKISVEIWNERVKF